MFTQYKKDAIEEYKESGWDLFNTLVYTMSITYNTQYLI